MLHVYVTFDVDQDDANTTSQRTQLTWHGIEKIPAIDDALHERGIPYTFFVRCDNQIHEVYGNNLAIFEKHRPLWERLCESGNEFGWHPHLYHKTREAYLPQYSPRECCVLLQEIWNDVSRIGFPVQVVRVGEAWHCNETMQLLNSLGLKVDSTAVPGRQRNDHTRRFDWIGTPNAPYHPSGLDYRIPAERESDALSILEVPMTTVPIQTDYDVTPLRRYLNLTFHHALFLQGLLRFCDEIQQHSNHHLTLIFHPDELLDRPANGLHDFGWANFIKNLSTLIDVLEQRCKPFAFNRLSEATP